MLKQNYNQLLVRYKNAEIYMNNPNIPFSEKEKYINEVCKITERLGILLDSIKNYTQEEALNGFKEGGK